MLLRPTRFSLTRSAAIAISLVLTLLPGKASAQLSSFGISEIMYAPTAPEPEWIEIANTDTVAHLLTGLSVRVRSKSVAIGSIELAARSYLVITKDSAALRAQHTDHPFSIGQIALPQLANTGDPVVLVDVSGAIIDSVYYLPGWGGKNGISLERKELDSSSLDPTNWGSSTSLNGSTPGLRNSITPPDRDLASQIISSSFLGDTLLLNVRVSNRGRTEAISGTLLIRRDDDHDSIFVPNETISTTNLPAIHPLASLDTLVRLPGQPPSRFSIAAITELPGDEVQADDIVVIQLPHAIPSGSIAINELMYAPTAPEPEWIELYNTTLDTIELGSAILHNQTGEARAIPAGTRIVPQAYVVVTGDTASLEQVRAGQFAPNTLLSFPIPSLNNAGGSITLTDPRGTVVDSFAYLPAWGGSTGKSLERIDFLVPATDSNNLGTSLDTSGATPGKSNSIERRVNDLAMGIPTDSVGRDRTIYLSIPAINRGRADIQSAALAIYSSETSSIPIATMQLPTPLRGGESSTIELSVAPSRYGLDTLTIIGSTTPDDVSWNDTARITITVPIPPRGIAINEAMISPLSSSCQWIEYYNTSSIPICMGGLVVSTYGPASHTTLILPAARLEPRSFALLAADSTLFNQFPSSYGQGQIMILNRSDLGMARTTTRIAFRNQDSSVIDTARFDAQWLPSTLGSGISIERVSRDRSSLDSTNWAPSVALAGGTPLADNSVADSTLRTGNVASLTVTPNPISPDGDGIDDVGAVVLTTGFGTESIVRLRLFDAHGRVVRTVCDGRRVFRSETMTLDGRDDNGKRLPLGLYTLLLESTEASGASTVARTGVVIAARAR